MKISLRKIAKTQAALAAAILCLSFLGATPTFASNASAGTIQSVVVRSEGIVVFYTTGTRTALPSCHTSTATRWAIDGTTAGGQAMLAVLMSAFGMGKQITVNGTGGCSAWSDTETALFIQVLG